MRHFSAPEELSHQEGFRLEFVNVVNSTFTREFSEDGGTVLKNRPFQGQPIEIPKEPNAESGEPTPDGRTPPSTAKITYQIF